MVDALLKNADIRASELNCIAVAAGPGSFTGVRIGCATAKGLAFALGIETRAVSTLASMADYSALWCAEPSNSANSGYGNISHPYILSCEMDARRGQIYNALFKITARAVQRLTYDRVIMNDELEAEFAYYNESGEKIFRTNTHSAVGVALAAQSIKANEANPVYLRKPQAEREYDKRSYI
jgi:tRNA threonylcarbamoyladenosine biosynthesis protein TsaB